MKRLSILTLFLRSMGIAVKDIPEHLLKRYTMNTCSYKDDMLYSTMLNIIKHYGYTLKVQFIPSGKSSLKECNNKRIIVTERLDGLAELINKHYTSLKDFAEAIGASPGAVWHWIDIDNFQISKFFQIAKATQTNLLFEIVPMSTMTEEEEEEPHVSLFLHTHVIMPNMENEENPFRRKKKR